MTKKPTEYDITKAFQEMEEYLISSMCRNLYKHINDDTTFTMWQTEQLKQLALYRKNNEELFKGYRKTINADIDKLLNDMYVSGYKGEEVKILKEIRNNKPKNTESTGTGVKFNNPNVSAKFFGVNDDKLKSLIKSTTSDIDKVTVATLRNANDQYRKIIYNTQVALNTGTLTLDQAVKKATHDFLKKGINSVQYSNGAKVNIASYSEMALRTANKRAKLQGEGKQREEIGIKTVLVVKSGNACPKCRDFLGKVFIDDIWSGGTKADGNYPLLSTAVEGGLYHPNCRDTHVTFIEGITSIPPKLTEQQKAEQEKKYNLEQQQRYYERQLRQAKRLRDNAMTEEDKAKYDQRCKVYSGKINELVKKYPNWLRRKPNRESTYGIGKLVPPVTPITPTSTVVKAKPPKPKHIEPTTAKVNKPAINMDMVKATTDGKPVPNADEHIKELTKLMEQDRVPDVARQVWNKFAPELKFADAKHSGGAYYNVYGVHLDMEKVAQGNSYDAPYSTFFHEFGHNIDRQSVRNLSFSNAQLSKLDDLVGSTGGRYSNKIKEEVKKNYVDYVLKGRNDIKSELGTSLMDSVGKVNEFEAIFTKDKKLTERENVEKYLFHGRGRHRQTILGISQALYKDEIKRVVDELLPHLGSRYRGRATGCISDMIEGSQVMLGDYFLGIGHGKSYWKTHDVCTEAFAEMFESLIANPDSLKVIKYYFPESFEIFLEILENMTKI